MSTTTQQESTASQNGNHPIAKQLVALKAKRQQIPIQQNKRSRFAWTGFSDKTLWDWLQMLAALAIPIVVAVGTIWFSNQQNEISLQISQTQHRNDQQSIDDQQQETALKTYLDDMSTLLLTNKLRESQENDEVRQVARAKTLTVLHKLNSERKATLIQFLYEAQLINDGGPIVRLDHADLSGADLDHADLSGADLDNALQLHFFLSSLFL